MNNISNPGIVGQPPQEAPNARRNPKANTHAAQNTTQPQTAPTAANESGDTTTQKAQGVLRLLQEGHFKGVADARLRINFAEEIAALQDLATRHTAQVGSDELVARAEAEITAFLQDDTLDEEATQGILAAQDVLEIAVQAAREALAETHPPDIFQFISDLQTAADDFLATLGDLLDIAPITITQTTPEGDTSAPDGVTPPATTQTVPPVEEFVSSLADALNTIIAELDQALQNISVLPPLAEPNGNGGAFDKFAAALAEAAAAPETNDLPESLDIIA